jgi:hypothetical protein
MEDVALHSILGYDQNYKIVSRAVSNTTKSLTNLNSLVSLQRNTTSLRLP